ncbi:MAG: hypothetical protein JXR77_05905, partial [Lentisphaeria bacterium]|nr:hypothetical protein [Lentisphaeria bacterium]
MPTDVIERIRGMSRSETLREAAASCLLRLCAIDTTPFPDVERMRRAESDAFDILERELDRLSFPGARRERRPVNPAVAGHPAYSQLHFTKTPERPRGLDPETVYANRANLLYFV